MSMVSFESGAIADVGTLPRPRAALWRGPRFIAEVFDGADEALAALEAIQSGLCATPFQSLNWLTLLYEELAPAQGAMARVVVVTERNSGEVAIVLPLLVKKKRRLSVARIADLGVAGCGAPILGPAPLTKTRSIRRVWRAIRHALQDIDLIRFERMPARICGRPNPLLTRAGLAPARQLAYLLDTGPSFEDYLAGRSRKYLREVARCGRRLAKQGRVRFFRAEHPEDVARVYTALEEQQAARHQQTGRRYKLGEPAQRAFYERIAFDGTDADFGYVYALEVDGEIIAALLGVRHDSTFAMLRVSTAGPAWKRFAPGRLVVLEVMRDMISRGVTHFDFGLRDKGFKQSFGAEAVPLHDLIVARDLAALPRATFHRLKGRLRKNARLRRLGRRLRTIFGRRH